VGGYQSPGIFFFVFFRLLSMLFSLLLLLFAVWGWATYSKRLESENMFKNGWGYFGREDSVLIAT
jgi:hypothetical protein